MNMYSVYDAKEMLDNNSDIFYINDEFDIESTSKNYRGEELRINHSACEEVKVIYNEEYEEYARSRRDVVFYMDNRAVLKCQEYERQLRHDLESQKW